jgi:hypothetical protein
MDRVGFEPTTSASFLRLIFLAPAKKAFMEEVEEELTVQIPSAPITHHSTTLCMIEKFQDIIWVSLVLFEVLRFESCFLCVRTATAF